MKGIRILSFSNPLFLFAFLLLGSRSPARERAVSRAFDSDGVKISYFVEGDGEPVVLIHGWLSSAGINWQLPGTVDRLAAKYRVIAFDARGHGLSGKPVRSADYGMPLVEDVVRLLDHLEIRKAHIVGYSMGGIIAAKFLAIHPDRALSGTLCGAGWLREGSAQQKIFAAGGRDGKPVGLCFQGLAKLALTEEEIQSIPVPVSLLIGDQDGLKALYVDPLRKVREDWPVTLIRDANHITCVLKPQFQEEILSSLKES